MSAPHEESQDDGWFAHGALPASDTHPPDAVIRIVVMVCATGGGRNKDHRSARLVFPRTTCASLRGWQSPFAAARWGGRAVQNGPMISSRAAVAICLAAAAAPAQPRKFDLQRNFFASDALEAQDRRDVVAQFGRLERMAKTATRSQASLRATLLLWSDLEKRFRLHDLYFFARSAVNTEDRHEPEVQEVRQARRSATRAVRQAICATPEAHLHRLTRPPSDFAFFVRSTKEECAHRPAAEAQAVIDRYDFVSDPSFYFDAVSRTQFGTVRSSGGQVLDVLKDQGVLLADDSASVREETEKKLWDGFASHAELFAHGLAQIVRACDAKARSSKYASCMEQALAGEELAPPLVRRWYDEIAASWQWARTVPEAHRLAPSRLRFSFDDAAAIIGRAVAPLGPDYQRETLALFDPRNGRVDVEGGPHRLPMQGTSSVDPIGTSIFYAFQFAGNYLDLMLLAHESGHATQAMMMSRNGVAPLNGRGPAWVTESFGRFNEFLVAGDLVRNERDPSRKSALRQELLGRAFVLYGAATEGAVEIALHDAVIRGERPSPEQFAALTRSAGSRFSDRFEQKNDALLWTRVESYYGDPLHSTSSMILVADLAGPLPEVPREPRAIRSRLCRALAQRLRRALQGASPPIRRHRSG